MKLLKTLKSFLGVKSTPRLYEKQGKQVHVNAPADGYMYEIPLVESEKTREIIDILKQDFNTRIAANKDRRLPDDGNHPFLPVGRRAATQNIRERTRMSGNGFSGTKCWA